MYIKRGGVVAPWDGRSPVRPGDLIGIEAGARGHGFASVASLGASGGDATVLWAGRLSDKEPAVLPISLRVDDVGQQEIVSVILAPHPVDQRQHRAFVPEGALGETATWRKVFVFPKELRP